MTSRPPRRPGDLDDPPVADPDVGGDVSPGAVGAGSEDTTAAQDEVHRGGVLPRGHRGFKRRRQIAHAPRGIPADALPWRPVPRPTAAIVVIGDEILSGKFAEENAAFLIGELRSLGVDLRRITIIPDDLDEIAATVAAAAAAVDHVFTSGGVGPTHDDVTIAAVARAMGTDVVRHPDLEARVRAYWGDAIAPANLRLADVPRGATLLWGSSKVWPVVAIGNVHILPGVPSLFRSKFVDIRERFRAAPVAIARLWIAREEGALAADLDAVVAAHPSIKVGSYPRFDEPTFQVIVTLEGDGAGPVAAAADELAARLGAAVVRRTAE
jgi:molybdenum cofactor synthesis domain-containing protein